VGTTWLLTAILAQTPEIQSTLDAELLYTRGLQARADPAKVAQAADMFRAAAQVLRGFTGLKSPSLQRTLGHAYFLSGDLPHALAAYRRGLRIDPGDAKLATALAYARAQVQYPPAPDLARLLQPERDYWPGWLSLRHLGLYAFLLYFAACLAATRWRMTRRGRWLAVAALALTLAAVPAVGSAVLWQRERRDAATPVVVVARDCPLRVGNGPDYPPRLDAPLPRGAEARRLFERNGWFQVELASGVVGWLPRDAVVGDEAG
jgi:hypothetical protein